MNGRQRDAGPLSLEQGMAQSRSGGRDGEQKAAGGDRPSSALPGSSGAAGGFPIEDVALHVPAGRLGPWVIPADVAEGEIEDAEALVLESADLIREFNAFLDAIDEHGRDEDGMNDESPFADKTRARARTFFDRSSALLNRMGAYNGESGALPVDLATGEMFVAAP